MKTLRITEELAQEMISRNTMAYSFIMDEECLDLGCEEENLNMLLGITLFRDDYDREPLKEEEIKILKDSYNIIYKEKKEIVKAAINIPKYTQAENLNALSVYVNNTKEKKLDKQNKNKLNTLDILKTTVCACKYLTMCYANTRKTKRNKMLNAIKSTPMGYKPRNNIKIVKR